MRNNNSNHHKNAAALGNARSKGNQKGGAAMKPAPPSKGGKGRGKGGHGQGQGLALQQLQHAGFDPHHQYYTFNFFFFEIQNKICYVIQ